MDTKFLRSTKGKTGRDRIRTESFGECRIKNLLTEEKLL
jgi:hypothetical protein